MQLLLDLFCNVRFAVKCVYPPSSFRPGRAMINSLTNKSGKLWLPDLCTLSLFLNAHSSALYVTLQPMPYIRFCIELLSLH